jgi:hypothetical protein
MFHRHSQQVVQLYDPATSLLVGERIDMVGIALMNNIGAWCYQNGDYDSADRCMEQLAHIVVRNQAGAGLLRAHPHGDEQRGILQNVACILTPRGRSTSPAA